MILKLWKICQSNPARQRKKSENIQNSHPAKCKVFLNYLKYANHITINAHQIQNDEIIFNLVPLYGNEFRKY